VIEPFKFLVAYRSLRMATLENRLSQVMDNIGWMVVKPMDGSGGGLRMATNPFKSSILTETHFVTAYIDEKPIAFYNNRRIICYHLFGTLI